MVLSLVYIIIESSIVGSFDSIANISKYLRTCVGICN